MMTKAFVESMVPPESYDDLFSFGFQIKIDDDKTVGVNIEFTSLCEYELEEYDFKINHLFPKQQREDFVRAIVEKYPMKEFKTLEATDLINPFARQLKSLYESNTVHTYQTDLANDMFIGDTFLFISDIPIDVAAVRRQERAKPRMRFC